MFVPPLAQDTGLAARLALSSRRLLSAARTHTATWRAPDDGGMAYPSSVCHALEHL